MADKNVFAIIREGATVTIAFFKAVPPLEQDKVCQALFDALGGGSKPPTFSGDKHVRGRLSEFLEGPKRYAKFRTGLADQLTALGYSESPD